MTDSKQDWSTNPENINLKYQEKKGDITADLENVKTVIRRYYQQLYPTKKLSFDDKDIFLGRTQFSKIDIRRNRNHKNLLKNLKAEKLKKYIDKHNFPNFAKNNWNAFFMQ